MGAKIKGRRNPFTVVRAIFDALAQTRTYRQIALDAGLNYYEMCTGNRFIRKERPPTDYEMKKRTLEIQGLIAKAGVHFKHVRSIRDAWGDMDLELGQKFYDYYDDWIEDDEYENYNELDYGCEMDEETRENWKVWDKNRKKEEEKYDFTEEEEIHEYDLSIMEIEEEYWRDHLPDEEYVIDEKAL